MPDLLDPGGYLLLTGGPAPTPPATPAVLLGPADYLLLVGVAGSPPAPPPIASVLDPATYLLLVGVAGTPPSRPPSGVAVPDAAWWWLASPPPTPPAPALPASLLAAIKAYWGGGSGLAAAVGPLSAGRARPGQDPPFARVQEITNRGRFDTGPGGVEYVELQLDAFAAGEQAAEDAGRLIREALADPLATLLFADGRLVSFRRVGVDRLVADPDLDTKARKVWHKVLTYRATVSRDTA